MGTLKAGLRLTFGCTHSGAQSAGNGPAMRAPIIAAWTHGRTPDTLEALIKVSTEVTHLDPRAYWGSLVLARLTRQLMEGTCDQEGLVHGVEDRECRDIVTRAFENTALSPQELCWLLGYRAGVSGFIYHTMAVVLAAVVGSDGSFQEAVVDTIRCGGDSDSTAALVGGILGAAYGPERIPADWVSGLRDWPLNSRTLQDLAQGDVEEPSFAACLARNLVVGPALMACAMRRLLPPY